jgi:hypothetical protein
MRTFAKWEREIPFQSLEESEALRADEASSSRKIFFFSRQRRRLRNCSILRFCAIVHLCICDDLLVEENDGETSLATRLFRLFLPAPLRPAPPDQHADQCSIHTKTRLDSVSINRIPPNAQMEV